MNKREERFIVDAMLGNIVTWLRILGYDTIYWNGDDGGLIEKALKEDRIILTMDRELALNAIRNGLETFYILKNDSPEVLAELAERYGIELHFDPNMTRCPVCNAPLKFMNDKPREEWMCPNCGKRYWKGSHWKNIVKTIKDAEEKLIKLRSSI